VYGGSCAAVWVGLGSGILLCGGRVCGDCELFYGACYCECFLMVWWFCCVLGVVLCSALFLLCILLRLVEGLS